MSLKICRGSVPPGRPLGMRDPIQDVRPLWNPFQLRVPRKGPMREAESCSLFSKLTLLVAERSRFPAFMLHTAEGPLPRPFSSLECKGISFSLMSPLPGTPGWFSETEPPPPSSDRALLISPMVCLWFLSLVRVILPEKRLPWSFVHLLNLELMCLPPDLIYLSTFINFSRDLFFSAGWNSLPTTAGLLSSSSAFPPYPRSSLVPPGSPLLPKTFPRP